MGDPLASDDELAVYADQIVAFVRRWRSLLVVLVGLAVAVTLLVLLATITTTTSAQQ